MIVMVAVLVGVSVFALIYHNVALCLLTASIAVLMVVVKLNLSGHRNMFVIILSLVALITAVFAYYKLAKHEWPWIKEKHESSYRYEAFLSNEKDK
jgi:hypothetical protein